MSGHSKWKNIQRTKGIQDSKRGNLFTKLSKDIYTAVQVGGGKDPEINSLLRLAVQKAKDANMPNDRINKAINRGEGQSNDIIDKTYEVLGPGDISILIDCRTDNSARTIAQIRNIVGKLGFKVMNEGSVMWKFREVGKIILKVLPGYSKEQIMIELMDIPKVNDIDDLENGLLELIVEKESLREIHGIISLRFSSNLAIEEIGIVKVSLEEKSINDEIMQQLNLLEDQLKDLPEVEEIWMDDLI